MPDYQNPSSRPAPPRVYGGQQAEAEARRRAMDEAGAARPALPRLRPRLPRR